MSIPVNPNSGELGQQPPNTQTSNPVQQFPTRNYFTPPQIQLQAYPILHCLPQHADVQKQRAQQYYIIPLNCGVKVPTGQYGQAPYMAIPQIAIAAGKEEQAKVKKVQQKRDPDRSTRAGLIRKLNGTLALQVMYSIGLICVLFIAKNSLPEINILYFIIYGVFVAVWCIYLNGALRVIG